MIIFVLSSSKSVIFLVVLMRFLPSNGSHCPCDFDALFLLFLKIFVFIWFVTIFFIGIWKKKSNYKSIETCSEFSKKLYEKGYSGLDIINYIENSKNVENKYLY